MTAPAFIEYGIDKVERPPLTHETTHPDHTDDPAGAAGALVALDGPPVHGGVPTYDSGTGKHTSQVPGASGGFVPTYIGPGETFTIPVNKQAVFLFPVVNDGDLVISGDFGQVD
jgi:hypothetical protein